MQIIGHRGARDLAPENTVIGFTTALKYKPDWIEIDVRTSRDGVPFVVHDPWLGRLAGKPTTVSRLTGAELEKLHGKHGEAFITLEKALKTIIPRAKVVIEIKTLSAVEPTMRVLVAWQKKGFGPDYFLVQSFWPHVLRAVHKSNPALRLGLLQHISPLRFLAVRLPLYGVGFMHRAMPIRAVRLAQKRGLWVYAHTVDKPLEAKKLQEWGVQAIVTNRPDIFAKK